MPSSPSDSNADRSRRIGSNDATPHLSSHAIRPPPAVDAPHPHTKDPHPTTARTQATPAAAAAAAAAASVPVPLTDRDTRDPNTTTASANKKTDSRIVSATHPRLDQLPQLPRHSLLRPRYSHRLPVDRHSAGTDLHGPSASPNTAPVSAPSSKQSSLVTSQPTQADIHRSVPSNAPMHALVEAVAVATDLGQPSSARASSPAPPSSLSSAKNPIAARYDSRRNDNYRDRQRSPYRSSDRDDQSTERRLARNRERNREHARKTRMRKKAQLEALQRTVEQLQTQRQILRQSMEDCSIASILVGLSSSVDTHTLNNIQRPRYIHCDHIDNCPGNINRQDIVSSLLVDATHAEVEGMNAQNALSTVLVQNNKVHDGTDDRKSVTDNDSDKSTTAETDSCRDSRKQIPSESLVLVIDGKPTTVGGERTHINWKSRVFTDQNGGQHKLTQKQLDKLRRERNRMHAKLTRDRKKSLLRTMERTVDELQTTNRRMKEVLQKVAHQHFNSTTVLPGTESDPANEDGAYDTQSNRSPKQRPIIAQLSSQVIRPRQSKSPVQADIQLLRSTAMTALNATGTPDSTISTITPELQNTAGNGSSVMPALDIGRSVQGCDGAGHEDRSRDEQSPK